MTYINRNPATRTQESYSSEEGYTLHQHSRRSTSHEVDPHRSTHNLQNLESNSRRQAELSDEDWYELEEGLDDQGEGEWDTVFGSGGDFSDEETDVHSRSASLSTTELRRLNKEIDQLKSEIRGSNLDYKTKNTLMRQVIEASKALQKGGDPGEFQAIVEGVRQRVGEEEVENAAPPADEQPAEGVDELKENVAEFKQELNTMKSDRQLTAEEVNTYKTRAGAIVKKLEDGEIDLRRAKTELENLTEEVNTKLRSDFDSKRAEKEALKNKIISAMDLVVNMQGGVGP